MARITVEDCIKKIQNRFDLVVIAAQRARQIGAGAPINVERNKDKNPVVALREISEGKVSIPAIESDLIKGHRRVIEESVESEEILELMEEEQEAFGVNDPRAASEMGEELKADVLEEVDEEEAGAFDDNVAEDEDSDEEEPAKK